MKRVFLPLLAFFAVLLPGRSALGADFVLVLNKVDSHSVTAGLFCKASLENDQCEKQVEGTAGVEVSRTGGAFTSEPSIASVSGANATLTLAKALKAGDRVRLVYSGVTSEDRCLFPAANDLNYQYDRNQKRLTVAFPCSDPLTLRGVAGSNALKPASTGDVTSFDLSGVSMSQTLTLYAGQDPDGQAYGVSLAAQPSSTTASTTVKNSDGNSLQTTATVDQPTTTPASRGPHETEDQAQGSGGSKAGSGNGGGVGGDNSGSGDFTVNASTTQVAPGQSVTFSLTAADKSKAPGTPQWSVSPSSLQTPDMTMSSQTLTFTAPDPRPSGLPHCNLATFTAVAGGFSHSVQIHLQKDTSSGSTEPCPGANIVTSVIGFEQAGASSSQAAQKFFFDIFIDRALGGNADEVWGPRWRWWGNVRIGSYPQQVTTPLADFLSAGISDQIGKVPVNKLAQFGEFRIGPEARIHGFKSTFLPRMGAAEERTSLNAFAGFGALGALNSTPDLVQVFNIPATGTPQYAQFQQNFPSQQYPNLYLAGTKYIGFAPPDRDRFYREYGAGLRFVTRYFDPDGNSLPDPAMLSISAGQNELVSGGRLRGAVLKVEGFYPLSLGARATGMPIFYLFGRVDLRLGAATQRTPLILATAASSITADNSAVSIVATPSTRDLYTVGVGVDAIGVIKDLMSKKSSSNTKTDSSSSATADSSSPK